MEPYAPYPLNLLRDWLHRRRWWVRLALTILIAPGFSWFAYTRVTTPPVGPPLEGWGLGPGLNIPDPSVDRTKDLDDAIGRLMPVVSYPVPTTAPAGMVWLEGQKYTTLKTGESARRIGQPNATTFALDPGMALVGEWSPDQRLHLAKIIEHLDSPEVQEAMEEITELSDEPFCISYETSNSGFGGLRNAARWFVARARYRMVEKDDFNGAVEDIAVALRLGAETENDGTLISLMVGQAIHQMAIAEITHWTTEFDLTAEQWTRLEGTLRSNAIDTEAMRLLALQGEAQMRRSTLDTCFTRSDDGDGWFVLSQYKVDGSDKKRPAILSLLNVCSPLFESRAQAESVLEHWEAAVLAGYKLPGVDDGNCCPNLPVPYRPTSLAQYLMGISFSYDRIQNITDQYDAVQQGAHAMLAMQRYKLAQGVYPERLQDLIPDYLNEVPIDPFTEQPLVYRRNDEGDYVLYSVGEDGDDDGGGVDAWRGKRADGLIKKPRGNNLWEEWVLVPDDFVATMEKKANRQPSR